MMDSPVRVLEVLTVPFKQNGITRCVMNYVSRFDSARVRCDLVAPNLPDEASIRMVESTGGEVFVLDRRNGDPAGYMHRLSIIVSERGEQVVHAHGNSATLAIEMLAARNGGAKVRVAHSHNTTCKMKLADRLLRELFYQNYTDAMACGEAAGKWLFGERPFAVLNNAVPAEKYHFEESKRAFTRGEYGIEPDAFAVCHVGTFNEQKNQLFLLEAFRELLNVRPESFLLLVGEGPNRTKCEQKAKALGVSDRVLFTGVLADVTGILSAADVFALPSLYEGLPLTLIEAQCAGLPCVASEHVTREAALTPLAAYAPIESAAEFARALAGQAARDRDAASEDAISLVRAAGYDVTANAESLSKWYETLARRASAAQADSGK